MVLWRVRSQTGIVGDGIHARFEDIGRRWAQRVEFSAGNVLASNPLAPKQPHFAAKAKRVIYLFQAGAPSHLELFDYKPELAKWDGKLPPAELLQGYRAAFISPNSALLGPKFKFAKHGACGAELSELLPHTASIADECASLSRW